MVVLTFVRSLKWVHPSKCTTLCAKLSPYIDDDGARWNGWQFPCNVVPTTTPRNWFTSVFQFSAPVEWVRSIPYCLALAARGCHCRSSAAAITPYSFVDGRDGGRYLISIRPQPIRCQTAIMGHNGNHRSGRAVICRLALVAGLSFPGRVVTNWNNC